MNLTHFERRARDRSRTFLLGLLALALIVAYHILPVLLWGPEP